MSDEEGIDLDEYHERQREIAMLLARYAAWTQNHHKSGCPGYKGPCSCGLSALEEELQKHSHISVRALAEIIVRGAEKEPTQAAMEEAPAVKEVYRRALVAILTVQEGGLRYALEEVQERGPKAIEERLTRALREIEAAQESLKESP